MASFRFDHSSAFTLPSSSTQLPTDKRTCFFTTLFPQRLMFKSFLWRASLLCLHPNIEATELIMSNDVILHVCRTVQLPKCFHKCYVEGSLWSPQNPEDNTWSDERVARCVCACDYYYFPRARRNLRLKEFGEWQWQLAGVRQKEHCWLSPLS